MYSCKNFEQQTFSPRVYTIVSFKIAFRVADDHILIFIAKEKNFMTTGIYRSIDISNEFLVDSPLPLRRVFDGTLPLWREEGERGGAEWPVAGSRNYGALLQLCRDRVPSMRTTETEVPSLSSFNRGHPIFAFSSAFRGTSARFRIPGDRSQVVR